MAIFFFERTLFVIENIKIPSTVRDGPFDSQEGGGYRFLLMLEKFFSLHSLVQLFFLFSTEQNFFYSDEEDGIFLCGEMFQS